MKKSIWSRLIICFLLAGVITFLLLNTYGMNLLEKRLRDNKLDLMYKEADLISSEYMENFYHSNMTLEALTDQLRSIDTFLGLRVWIVNSDGTIIADSSYTGNAVNINLNELDPSFLSEET
ncbi:MAG TPA: hypothetical protein DDY59_13250, partial [Lachnospiraceae bacterium]|nr:hypothetical protein [Lachnospiraceae bacterium]